MSSKFVRLAVLNKHVKFSDPRLNRYPEIRPEAVGGDIFDRFFFSNFRKYTDHK